MGEPVTASALTIERTFGVPARTVRRWAQHGLVSRDDQGQVDVRQVLERDQGRRHDGG